MSNAEIHLQHVAHFGSATVDEDVCEMFGILEL